ncbi:hypothetical protein [Nocardiopsis sp. CA-288880]
MGGESRAISSSRSSCDVLGIEPEGFEAALEEVDFTALDLAS